jgi:hypothetical protein
MRQLQKRACEHLDLKARIGGLARLNGFIVVERSDREEYVHLEGATFRSFVIATGPVARLAANRSGTK